MGSADLFHWLAGYTSPDFADMNAVGAEAAVNVPIIKVGSMKVEMKAADNDIGLARKDYYC